MNLEKLIVPLAILIGAATGGLFWYVTGEAIAFAIVFLMIVAAPLIYRMARRRDEKKVNTLSNENDADRRERFQKYSEENGFERAEDMVSDVKKRYKKFAAWDNIARAVFMGAFSVAGVFFFDEVATDLFLKIVYICFIIVTAACSAIFFRSFIACFTAFPMHRFLKDTSLDTGKLNESYCTSGVLSNDKCGISIGGDYLMVFKSLHFIAVPVSDITFAIKLDRTSRGHSFSGSSHKTEFLHSVAVYTRTNGTRAPIEALLTEHQCELVCEELIRKGIEVRRINC